ncbi:putative defense protein Hdd11-like [Penaeus japonicus]|uniref:putative defense protein Hdd11-like n=1 Tax=Penaeus japonicus TaxID=27405 RepID=UPI001C7161D0|nr:putative defense protein Hdd11-like [Penaeus japonicus]
MAGRVAFVVAVSVWCSVVWSMPLTFLPSTCETMLPQGLVAAPQTSDAPFVLLVPEEMIPSGSEVNVVLAGFDPEVKFEGFFIEAYGASEQPIGTFVTAPMKLDCGGPATAAYSADSTEKVVQMLSWKSPENMKGTVTFRGTVIMNNEIFWVNVVSKKVMLV